MIKSGSNIYLIGPMGSGKTTVGQRVAKQLEMEFLDCDRKLEKQTGASINLIFDVEGESGFRKRESRMLKVLTSRQNILLATGGGTILDKENRELLKRTGLVVYLQTSVSQQLDRLRLDRTRPLLQEGDRQQKLTRLAAARNSLYEELADLVFPSTNRGPEITARHLTKAILSYWDPSSTTDTGIDPDCPSHGTV
ncbi:MAG: shikimate kinase [Xanthomonadales bacterium]